MIDFFGVADVADQLAGPIKAYAAAWIPDQPGRMELARRLSPINMYVKDYRPFSLCMATPTP